MVFVEERTMNTTTEKYLDYIQARTEEHNGLITVHPLGDDPFTVTEEGLNDIAAYDMAIYKELGEI